MTPSLAPHRLWLTALVLAFVLLAAAPSVASLARTDLIKEREALAVRRETLQNQILQWETDAQAAAELAEALRGDDVNAYIAPSNRAKAAAQLEALAAQTRLSRLIYAIGPEEEWSGDPTFPEIQGVKQSPLFVEADAALDTDVFAFLENLSRLPGRMDLQRLTIKRTENETPAPALALHMQAELTWVANAQEKANGK